MRCETHSEPRLSPKGPPDGPVRSFLFDIDLRILRSMPLQDSWVELWLDRYCPPGHHQFRAIRADVLTCTLCSKQELIGGATCLICGIPGEVPTTLEHVGPVVERITGRLCGSCLDEFAERRDIGGWRIAS